MESSIRLLFLSVLTFIVFLTSWLILSSHHIETKKNNPSQPHSFMTNIRAIKMNEEGKPNYILTSPKSIYYLKDNTTQIKKPFFIINRDNEPPWHIQAKHGTATEGTNKIILTGEVHIQQLPGKNSRNVTFKTSKLTFYPNRSFAETDQPVTITQPGSIAQAVGLEADLNKDYIKLLSDTRAQYGDISKE